MLPGASWLHGQLWRTVLVLPLKPASHPSSGLQRHSLPLLSGTLAFLSHAASNPLFFPTPSPLHAEMLYPHGLLRKPLRFALRRLVVGGGGGATWRPGAYLVLDTGAQATAAHASQ